MARIGGHKRPNGEPALSLADIEAFAASVVALLESAEADRRTVEALRALVGGKGAAAQVLAPAAKAAARVPGRRGRPPKAATEAQVDDGRILALVQGAKGGARLGDLVSSLRVRKPVLVRTLRRLREEGKLKMTGEKRLARYHVA